MSTLLDDLIEESNTNHRNEMENQFNRQKAMKLIAIDRQAFAGTWLHQRRS